MLSVGKTTQNRRLFSKEKMFVLVVLFFSGCGSPKAVLYETPQVYVDNGPVSAVETYGEAVIDKFVGDSRQIIRSAYLTLKADSAALVHEQVIDIMKAMNGYMVRTEKNMTVIRVPGAKFDATLTGVRRLGEVLDESTYGEDVTERYRDLGIRLENALKTRDRYLALLDKATSVEEMLQIDRELERLNGKIERLKGQRQNLSHLTDFATIQVSTKTPIRRGILGEVGYGIYKGVSWLFVRH